jgi:hypothetical protein
MNALRVQREEECIRALDRCLRESFPEDVARLNGKDLRAIVRLGMERSRSHGGVTTQDMYLYLTLMFMLGSYFDEDPQLAWAKGLLGRGLAMSVVHDQAQRYLNSVAGEANEHLIKALVRVGRLDLTRLPNADAEDFEPAIQRLLRSLYPTKYGVQGAEANRELAKLGKARAEKYAMPGAGAAILTTVAFMLGTGFDRDPVHPWLQSALSQPGGEAKVSEVFRRCVEFSALALR